MELISEGRTKATTLGLYHLGPRAQHYTSSQRLEVVYIVVLQQFQTRPLEYHDMCTHWSIIEVAKHTDDKVTLS